MKNIYIILTKNAQISLVGNIQKIALQNACSLKSDLNINNQ